MSARANRQTKTQLRRMRRAYGVAPYGDFQGNKRRGYGYGYSTLHPAAIVYRMRDLAVRSTLFQAMLVALKTNIVGEVGAQPTFSNVRSKARRDQLLAIWRDWARDPTTAGKLTWPQLLQSIVYSRFVDGRAFVLKRYHTDYNFGYAVTPLARDWLADWHMLHVGMIEFAGDKKEVTAGIARAKSGRVEGYVFYDKLSPQDITKEQAKSSLSLGVLRAGSRVFIPQNNVCDYYTPEHASDYLGIPTRLIGLLESLEQVGDLDARTVDLMNASVMRMGFIKKNPDASLESSIPVPSDESDDDYEPPVEFENNEIEELPAGYDFTPYEAKQPTGDMVEYRKKIIENAAAGQGFDYSTMAGDLTQVNYSSIRHGALNVRNYYIMRQQELEECVCRPILSSLLDWLTLRGDIKLSAADLHAAKNTEWRHRTWAWIDPLKDAKAIEVMLSNGLTSPQRVCSEAGTDWEQIVNELVDAKNTLPAEIWKHLTGQKLSALSDASAEQKPADDDMEVNENETKE